MYMRKILESFYCSQLNKILPIKEEFKGHQKHITSRDLLVFLLAYSTTMLILALFGKFLWNNYLVKSVTIVNPINSVFDLLALSILINLLTGN